MIDNGELLYQNLIDSFNAQELHTLCFKLRIEYDDLTGEGRESKVRELVKYFDRRDETDKLIATAALLRPKQQRWIDLASQCTQGNATGRILMRLIGRLENHQSQTDSRIDELTEKVDQSVTQANQAIIQASQAFSILYKLITVIVVDSVALLAIGFGILLILMRTL